MANPVKKGDDNPIRRSILKQHGGPGSDLVISLLIGLPLAVGAMTLLPAPFGLVAVFIELAVIALHLWEGQKMSRLKVQRERR